jgi:RHS repeat-associated protein
MAVWRVSEPWLYLRLEDSPVGSYQPGIGPRPTFTIFYRQNQSVTEYPTIFGLGTNWSCSLRKYIYADPGLTNQAYLHKGGASWMTYVVGSPQTRDGSLLSFVSSTSFKIEYMDGSKDNFSTPFTNSDGDVLVFITSSADPAGNSSTYAYSTNSGIFRFDSVTDADGHTAHLYYENGSFPAQITKVVDPYLRTNVLSYDSSGYLTNSVDAVSMISSFKYDSGANRGWITNLATPYGNTGFRFGSLDGGGTNRFAEVTLPTGGKHLFIYRDNTSFLSSWSPTVPTTSPFTNSFEQAGDGTYPQYNSFHWGPLQYVALSTNDPLSLTTNDYSIATLRHWLSGNGERSTALAIERAPSPDGIAEGQSAWYDYENKSGGQHNLAGTSDFPSFVAKVLPDGSTRYSYSLRGQHLNVTNEVSTYSATNGSVAVRTNIFAYATNAVDLLQHIGPRGEQVVSNYFAASNTFHQPDASYDALTQATLYTYNSYGQVTSLKTPAGLTTTNTFYPSGDSVNRLSTTADIEILRTNSYTYTNGLVATHTDARGLTTTSYWDKLQRTVGMAYPDGSTVSNIFTALDVTAKKDRLGQWTHFGFNAIRQMIAATNENGAVTRYGYCDCGALLTQTNAFGTALQQVSSFSYDYQGNRWLTANADGYSATNWFDSLKRVTITGDGTTYRYFYYNNQGAVTTVSNSIGAERKTTLDIENRPIYVTDVNGVTLTNTYDDLNRLLTRTYPDGGVEKLIYSARGMIAHTNQLNQASFFAYDEAGRKTAETNANTEVIRYTNNASGDVLSLTDPKNQTTRWNYDEYGRITNKLDQAGTEILRYKYDANGRLTNRWSVAKGNTYYAFDPVGNLTNIDYPSSHDVSFAYDALNRRTNMVDGVGTTAYTYTTGDQLLTEDGPWASDTVTNTYVNRLRTGLALAQPAGFWTNGLTYDTGARLSNVIMSAGTFAYTYQAGLPSRLPINLLLPNTSIITNTYDVDARLTGTYLKKNDNTVLDSYAYLYDPANERTNLTRADASTVAYSYDSIGQLKIADSSVNTEDRGYTYDAAWNLNWRTNNGSASQFKVNSLNELTNAPSPVGAQTYDSNGNLIYATNHIGVQNRIYLYSYDDENRLIELIRTNGISVTLTDFIYDGLGRLRERLEYTPCDPDAPPGCDWNLVSDTRYIYDGWRVIQERDGSNTPQVTYTRGSDLSGTMEGAGGIGGLLARSSGYSGGTGNWSTNNYYFADGNGNIAYIVDSTQILGASYRYDPFGNTISSSGSLASANVYRFSSKEQHVVSGMYYYGYRFYDPGMQRWLSRDPLGDESRARTLLPDQDFLKRFVAHSIEPFEALEGPNLYSLALNSPTVFVDARGLDCLYLCANILVGDILSDMYLCVLRKDGCDGRCDPIILAVVPQAHVFMGLTVPCPGCAPRQPPMA